MVTKQLTDRIYKALEKARSAMYGGSYESAKEGLNEIVNVLWPLMLSSLEADTAALSKELKQATDLARENRRLVSILIGSLGKAYGKEASKPTARALTKYSHKSKRRKGKV